MLLQPLLCKIQKWQKDELGTVQNGPEQPTMAQDSPEQPRTAQNGPEQPRTSQSSPAQPRAAENSPEQPRTAQNSPDCPRTCQNSPEQPRTAQNCPEHPRAAQNSPELDGINHIMAPAIYVRTCRYAYILPGRHINTRSAQRGPSRTSTVCCLVCPSGDTTHLLWGFALPQRNR